MNTEAVGQQRGVRLNKFIAQSGYCSRRAADLLIAAGKVLINGQKVTELGTRVQPETDEVRIRGGALIKPREESVLLMLNKPKGLVCTKSDPHEHLTVYDLLPPHFRDLKSIGRLDKDSEGLLLFTNNGDLAQQISHPSKGKGKVYQVTAKGRLSEKSLAQLTKGVYIPEFRQKVRAQELRELSYNASQDLHELEVTLMEGKNRQLRRMFLAIKHPIKKLRRVQVGSYRLGSLKPGEWRRIAI